MTVEHTQDPRSFHHRATLILACGIAFCATLCFTARTIAAPPKTTAADRAYRQQNWQAARQAYTQQLKATANWNTPQSRRIAERAVQCSLKLKDWKEALDLAEMFRRGSYKTDKELEKEYEKQLKNEPAADPNDWERQLKKQKRIREEEQSRMEFCRVLLARIAKAAAEAPAAFQARLAKSRIAGNFRLVSLLDTVIDDGTGIDWHPDARHVWWWRGIPAADRSFERKRRRFYRSGRFESIPVDDKGRPLFLKAPANYQAARSDGERVLFLLREAGRLDTTKTRDFAACALLLRHNFTNRLYGPGGDANWRASLMESASARSRAFWTPYSDPLFPTPRAVPYSALSDNQIRITVENETKVVTLPKSHSPLALLTRLETEFPRSRLVAEAIYQQGLYHQTRSHYRRALAAYRRLIARFPKQGCAVSANQRIAEIENSSVELAPGGVRHAGEKPTLEFRCRSTSVVRFRARRFDLAGYFRSGLKSGVELTFPKFVPTTYSAIYGVDEVAGQGIDSAAKKKRPSFEKQWGRYLARQSVRWQTAVPESLAAERHQTTAPLAEAGAYLVEATTPGMKPPARTLVIVTHVGLLVHSFKEKTVAWVVDAKSGRPLPGATVHDYVLTYDEVWKHHTGQTDANGLFPVQTKPNYRRFLLVDEPKLGLAFSLDEYGSLSDSFGFDPGSTTDPHVCWGAVDRPLYRPGDTVRFRAWWRDLDKRKYTIPKAGTTIQVEVRDQKWDVYKTIELQTDRDGSISGSFTLNREIALGEYHIDIGGNFAAEPPASITFRVEEFKNPEFEVTVSPTAEKHVIGKPIKARIRGRYYFDKPVAGASVSYKVYRHIRRPTVTRPHRFDWLYGNGFGLPGHRLSRLNAFLRPRRDSDDDAYRLDDDRYVERYLEYLDDSDLPIAEGTAKLDAQGVAEIVFATDTDSGRHSAAADLIQGYSYVIKAEVRDASRRTVEGTGQVSVERNAFRAHVTPDRNWYQPGDSATVTVATHTANDTPVASRGRLTLYRVAPQANGKNAADALQGVETAVASWPTQTNAEGTTTRQIPLREPGRYRVVYETRDGSKRTIRGSIDVWVYAPNMNPARVLLPGLQLIPDRRTYAVGDTARVLILSPYADPFVLLSHSFSEKPRFLRVTGNATVLEVQVTQKHSPLVELQAVSVMHGRSYTARAELFVPPVPQLLNVTLTPDRESYQPGQTGRVRIQVTDSKGAPVKGTLTLAGYDKSLTYIQPDNRIGPREFLLALRNSGTRLSAASSLHPRFLYSRNGIELPEFAMNYEPGAGLQIKDFFGEKHLWRGTMLRLLIRQTGGTIEEFETTLSLVVSSTNPWRSNIVHEYVGGIGGGGIGGGGIGGGPSRRLVPPKLRTDFNDQAVWLPAVKLDAHGRGTATVRWPESLTTWKLRSWIVSTATGVGEANVEVVTSKNLLVRLQTPRFFVENDRVVVSANVHNYLKTAKRVAAEIVVPAKLFDAADKLPPNAKVDADGNLHLVAEHVVAANGQHRFDWPLRVKSDGLAQITAKALTDEESDAVRLAFPVVPHGFWKQQARSGSFQSASRTVEFTIPPDADPAKTRVAVTLAPSAASTMFAALPYLANYPYGCVEQTLSRFYPTVLANKSLKNLGTNLEEVKQFHKRRRGLGHRRAVVDSKELQEMIEAGLQRLYAFQHKDGGWGWWKNDASSRYMTAYVLLGLHAAQQAGVDVRDQTISMGEQFLDSTSKGKDRSRLSRRELHEQAFVAYVITLRRMSNKQAKPPSLNAFVKSSNELNNYGKVLLALALHQAGKKEQAQTLLRRILKSARHDVPRRRSWLPISKRGSSWWQNETECNAWMLRTLIAMEPKNERIPQFANWLADQRRGSHWDSTRSTALAVTALTEYVRWETGLLRHAGGNSGADATVSIAIDGKRINSPRVNQQNLLKGQTEFVFPGELLKPGKHTVTFQSKGGRSIYYSLAVDVFRRPKRIEAAGHGLAIERHYYRIAPKSKQSRVPLKDGARIAVGDVVEVELHITAEADYEYLAFADPKPAGCEPVQLRSGTTWDESPYANVELRDRRVVFFAERFPRGKHTLKYRLRAVTPGNFHVLPAKGFAMYAPDIQARSDETTLKIE